MKSTLLLCCWLGPLMALAQNPYSNVPRYDQVPGYKQVVRQPRPVLYERPIPRSVVIKLNPLMAVGVDGAVYGGVEAPVGKIGAIQTEVGYGAFRSLMNFDSDTYTNKENWRARLQYRWYAREGVATSSPWYWAVEGTYKQVNAVDNQTLGRDCRNGNCAYFQLVNQLATRYVVGAYGKVGKIVPLTRLNGTYRFLLDLYAGLGINYAWTRRAPLDASLSGQYPSDYLFSPYYNPLATADRFGKSGSHTFFQPDIQVGFTVGYRVNE
ncbi:hypothetical protein [Fibrella aquatilis]|uniref:Outer membrane protein beta-barrel domain-containing protein n=1 Tax=Fibrella aquatilis TaxID=2817059 RepID=A0A939K012_9BACT|nr:hypothetical protein [Fibrella aquatilis]MBO0931511.1 hypothetical protein [Fibrella aquatilis]